MRIALTLSGTDAGRSGLGVYLAAILPPLTRSLASLGAELLVAGSPLDLAAYAPALARAASVGSLSTAALPAAVDRPGPGALWHLTRLGPWAERHGCRAVLAPAANRRLPATSLPCVAVVHDLAALLVRGKYDALRTLYARRFVAPALARASRLVAISGATRDDLCRLLDRPASTVPIVSNGVDTSRFHPGVAVDRSADPYLLYVSRLEHPGKNHIRLLEAYARSGARRSHRLVFAGGDWGARPLIERTIASLGLADRVTLAGRVDDDALPALTASASAALMLGLREGFGLPALEALACGVPVLVANAGALPEVTDPLGLLCDPLDIDSIALGLDRVVDPLVAARARDLGPAHAARFSWERTGHELATLCLGAAS